MSDEYEPRPPIEIPSGALIYLQGNDGYAEFWLNGQRVRVRVTVRRVGWNGGYEVLNTDELIA